MLAELIIRGERDLTALDSIERSRFDACQFSRLNIAEYIQDLETEGVAGLNFRYMEWVVRDVRTKPGLRAFIREIQGRYVGSEEMLARLLGS